MNSSLPNDPGRTRCSIRHANLTDAADGAIIVGLMDVYAADPMGHGQGLSQGVKEALVPALAAIPGCLVLEHLRGLRAGQDRIEQDVREVKHRLTSLENGIAGLRHDGLGTQEDVYRQQATVDKIKERLERIERRLELEDTSPASR